VNQCELERFALDYQPPETPSASAYNRAPVVQAWQDGDKFDGGFGPTQLLTMDYWTLRERSNQLFRENIYARGLINRLITNEIGPGLFPATRPEQLVLGLTEDQLSEWSEVVQARFNLWAENPDQCHWLQDDTFGAIQRAARTEALICGDVLVVARMSPKTKLPQIQLVSGARVQNPLLSSAKLSDGHRVDHGVERDSRGRVVAYWVKQKHDLTETQRISARGARTGRRIAWMVYGTPKRLDHVRGEPLLSIMLQSLKEIDRYRDSAQRKAVINSIMAMFIKKTEDKMGTMPLTSGATKRGKIDTTGPDGEPRKFNVTEQLPGLVLEELQQGEEPVLLGGQGTDVNFGSFEESIVQAIAWANEIPPEILKLAFSNNYSASQAAINEFKIYLNKIWIDFGQTFCHRIYVEWLVSEVLRGRIEAPEFLAAWRDPQRQDEYSAWTSCNWYGTIKPSTDMLKAAKASELLVANGWSNHTKEARNLTGTGFRENAKRLAHENELLIEAMRPMAEFKRQYRAELEEEPTKEETELNAMLDGYLDDQ
jgi:lambda family phage portal protein